MKNVLRLKSSKSLVGVTFTAAMGVAAIYSPPPASAGSGVSANATTYAYQSVLANNNTVNWPGSMTLTGASSVSPGSYLTLSLPSGMTFAQLPTLARSSHTSTSAVSNIAGTAAVTWTLTGSTSTGDTYVFSAFNISTGSLISSASTSPYRLTVALSGAGDSGTVTASSVNAFYANSGWTATFSSVAATINTSSPSNGSLFVTSATNTSRVAQLGSVIYRQTASGGTTSQNAATPTLGYGLPSGTTSALTVTGSLGQITRAYLIPGAACQTTAAAGLPTTAITSTVLAVASATFTSLVTGSTYNLCVENVGNSLISVSPILSATITPSGALGSSASALGSLGYSGTSNTLDYVVGGTSWQYFVRVVNPTSVSTQLFAAVTKDDGTSFSGSITTNLAAGNAALYSIADINTATGASLTVVDRARVNLLTSTAVNVSGVLYHAATGTVLQLPARESGVN